MGTVNICSGVKRLELEPNHSLLSRAAVKNEWSYKSAPPFTFVAWTVTALVSLTNPSTTLTLQERLHADVQYSNTAGYYSALTCLIPGFFPCPVM